MVLYIFVHDVIFNWHGINNFTGEIFVPLKWKDRMKDTKLKKKRMESKILKF